MKTYCSMLMLAAAVTYGFCADQLLFEDDFNGGLKEGWSWVREEKRSWRLTERGLEVRVEPGNMWGAQNNAKNLLVRPLTGRTNAEIEIAVTVENRPTHQYEQVNLVWYYDDSHMVKLGQELVDGQLSIVMGREEKDRCRTIAIIPLDSTSVRVRLFAKAGKLRGQFRVPSKSEWREVGECTMPAPPNSAPKISLHCYQGPTDVEHWARISHFQILERDP